MDAKFLNADNEDSDQTALNAQAYLSLRRAHISEVSFLPMRLIQ